MKMKKGPLFAAVLTLLLLAGCGMTTPPGDKTWDDAHDDIQEELDQLETESGALDETLAGIFDRMEEDSGAKTHRWQILDAQGEELYTVSDEENVAAVDDLLQGEGWDLAGGEPGQALYTYVFWQQKTSLAGQDPKAEREYEALIRFTVPAEGNEVTLEILPESLDGVAIAGVDLGELLTINSTVPEETAEALRSPSQWSE